MDKKETKTGERILRNVAQTVLKEGKEKREKGEGLDMSDDLNEEEESEDFVTWLERTFDIRTLPNPFNELTVMAMIVSGGRAILGGVREIDDNLQPVFRPMSFAEVPVKANQAGEVTEIGQKFSKIFVTLDMLDWMMFNPDSIYFLQANKVSNVALVSEYEQAVKSLIGADSNLTITDQMPAPGSIPHLEPVR